MTKLLHSGAAVVVERPWPESESGDDWEHVRENEREAKLNETSHVACSSLSRCRVRIRSLVEPVALPRLMFNFMFCFRRDAPLFMVC